MSGVRKALITAAGKGTRQYPASTTVQKTMFPLVDRDGVTKPTLQIIAEEAFEGGIEEIAIVVSPGDAESYRQHFRGIAEELLPSFQDKSWAIEESKKVKRLENAIHYITQESQEGYGHAVWCAKDWVGDEPVLLLLGDHVYISSSRHRCAEQIIDAYEEHSLDARDQIVLAVKATDISRVSSYGTLRGTPIEDRERTYRVDHIIEKPTPELARECLVTPGLPPDQFLCFFGMYVITPPVFERLDRHVKEDVRERGEIQLTGALQAVVEERGAIAYEADGHRYDMGIPFGYVETQFALALHSNQREQIIRSLQQILQQSGKEMLARPVGT